MERPLLNIAVAATLFITAATSKEMHAQTVELSALDPNNTATINDALETSAPDYYQRKEAERRKRFPVIVIIPGIMGSALIDRDSKKVLWGEKSVGASYDPKWLAYPSQRPVDVDILDSFNVLGSETDVYGKAIANLRSTYLSDKTFINVFPYDWRQDNRLSAGEFNKWYCANRDIFNGRSVIIAAHSMGGLIAKYWLKNYYMKLGTSCADGNPLPKPARLHLNFIGVPHYGAPKALKVFSNGFYLARSGDANSIFGAWIDKLDKDWLASAVNEYGFTFPSAYQLLPVYGEDCFKEKLKSGTNNPLPMPFLRTASDGRSVSYEDIFSPDLWSAMGWPKSGQKNLPPNFYSDALPKYLKSAYNFLCEVSTFVIPTEIEVAYFANNSFLTDGSYVFAIDSGGNSPKVHTVPGDETVPYIVAGDFLIRPRHTVLPIDPDLPHSYMLRSKFFWVQIENEMLWAENYSQKAAISRPEDREALREAYLRTNIVPTLPLAGGNDEVKKFAIGLATELFEKKGISATKIFDFAKTTGDLHLKNILYSSVSEMAKKDNPKLSVTAGNSITHVFIQNNLWAEAVTNSEVVRNSSAWGALTEKDRKEVGGILFNNEGWAKYKKGDFVGAKTSFKKALSYGNKKAINGLDELQAFQEINHMAVTTSTSAY